MVDEQLPNRNNQPPEHSDQARDETRPACACACSGNWKWFIIPVIVLIAILLVRNAIQSRSDAANPTEAASTNSISWNHDYDAGMAQAKQENKPVLLVFSASWCPPCKWMKENTYRDAAVVAKAGVFVTIYVDIDENASVTNKYGVDAYPTYFIVAADGTRVHSFVGVREPDDFIKELEHGLEMTNNVL